MSSSQRDERRVGFGRQHVPHHAPTHRGEFEGVVVIGEAQALGLAGRAERVQRRGHAAHPLQIGAARLGDRWHDGELAAQRVQIGEDRRLPALQIRQADMRRGAVSPSAGNSAATSAAGRPP